MQIFVPWNIHTKYVLLPTPRGALRYLSGPQIQLEAAPRDGVSSLRMQRAWQAVVATSDSTHWNEAQNANSLDHQHGIDMLIAKIRPLAVFFTETQLAEYVSKDTLLRPDFL